MKGPATKPVVICGTAAEMCLGIAQEDKLKANCFHWIALLSSSPKKTHTEQQKKRKFLIEQPQKNAM